MTPERCKDLVTDFDGSLQAPQLQRVPCGHALPCPLHSPPETKPSESSMVQRIESLERELEHICHSVRGARIGLAENWPGWMREWFDGIERRITTALDGPPDPERNRETRRETEAAEADDARLDAIEGENNYREIIDR